MKNKVKETSLISLKENSIFYKIKRFFDGIMNKKNLPINEVIENENISSEDNIEKDENSNENIDILSLQKKYRLGEINEVDLTQEQIDALCGLYQKQIEELKRSNEFRKNKILKMKSQLDSVK